MPRYSGSGTNKAHESDIRLRKWTSHCAAVEARKRKSEEAVEKFEEAVDVLVAFERDFPSAESVSDHQRDGIALRMAAAKKQDKSESTGNHENVLDFAPGI